MRTKIVVTLIGLSLLFLGLLYHSDSATVTQAEKVAAFTRNYCAEHEAYPEIAVMQAQFPDHLRQRAPQSLRRPVYQLADGTGRWHRSVCHPVTVEPIGHTIRQMYLCKGRAG